MQIVKWYPVSLAAPENTWLCAVNAVDAYYAYAKKFNAQDAWDAFQEVYRIICYSDWPKESLRKAYLTTLCNDAEIIINSKKSNETILAHLQRYRKFSKIKPRVLGY